MMKGKLELEEFHQGRSLIGIDEVGRGCLAGPVYAACVALDYTALLGTDEKKRSLIRDSKKLSSNQRQRVLPLIKRLAKEAYIASASEREIEALGIVDATFLAMRRCLRLCHNRYDLLLIDGKQRLPNYFGEQQNVIGGDALCYAIAAASILAKEARDAYMQRLANDYPEYGFESHVGYGTKQHLSMLEMHGICTLHRRNFAPVQRHLTP